MGFAAPTYFPEGEGDASMPSGATRDTIVTDATTNASSAAATYVHRTTGTPSAGIGVAVEYTTEDAGGADQDVAVVRYVLSTVTAGAEVGAVRFAIVNAGTVPAEGSEQHRFTPTQYLGPDTHGFTADADTYILRNGGDRIDVVVGNITRIRIDEGGISGVGIPGRIFTPKVIGGDNNGGGQDLQLAGTSGNTAVTIGSATVTLADAVNIVVNATTGTKIGTATGQKLGFWNASPVVQQVLATGAGATVDNVISLLQTIGLCRQS